MPHFSLTIHKMRKGQLLKNLNSVHSQSYQPFNADTLTEAIEKVLDNQSENFDIHKASIVIKSGKRALIG